MFKYVVVVQSPSLDQLFKTPWTAACQVSLSSPAPRICPSPCPLNRWCHPTISSSVTLFFCLQPFPASGSFPMSQLFTSSGQSIGVSASASVLPMSIQGWFALRLTRLISAVQGTLKSLLQYHSSEASILWHFALFMVHTMYKYTKIKSANSIFLKENLCLLLTQHFYPRRRKWRAFLYSCLGNPMDRGVWWATV